MLSIGEFDAIIFTLFSAAVVSTILRIYARRFVVRCMAVDDYLVVAAIVSLSFRHAFSSNACRQIFHPFLTFSFL